MPSQDPHTPRFCICRLSSWTGSVVRSLCGNIHSSLSVCLFVRVCLPHMRACTHVRTYAQGVRFRPPALVRVQDPWNGTRPVTAGKHTTLRPLSLPVNSVACFSYGGLEGEGEKKRGSGRGGRSRAALELVVRGADADGVALVEEAGAGQGGAALAAELEAGAGDGEADAVGAGSVRVSLCSPSVSVSLSVCVYLGLGFFSWGEDRCVL